MASEGPPGQMTLEYRLNDGEATFLADVQKLSGKGHREFKGVGKEYSKLSVAGVEGHRKGGRRRGQVAGGLVPLCLVPGMMGHAVHGTEDSCDVT